jgi:KUP system potassium uptake protein
MMLTTVLLLTAMIRVWRWPLWLAIPVASVFLIVDVGFFGANLFKIVDGGWLPLTLGGAIFFVMATWRAGSDAMRRAYEAASQSIPKFLAMLKQEKTPRVPGAAIFLTRAEDQIPSLMVDFVERIGSLHQSVIVLTVVFEETPRVAAEARSQVEELGGDIWSVTLRFGFVEIPNLPATLARVKDLDCKADIKEAVYFAARDLVVGKPRGRLRDFRLALFAWLFRNAVKAVDRFQLPAKNVIEIARQIEI